VDLLAGTGLMPVLDGREDADEREEPGAEIGERDAGLRGRAARLARHRHDARHALGHEIESALAALGPRLAVAGDRRVNQPRILRRERLVAEAERRHHPGPIVLDYDVCRAREPQEDAASLGFLEVQDEAALAAVDGIEVRAV